MGISIRGVARQFYGQTGAFSVRVTMLALGDTKSLRADLIARASREISFRFSECIFGGRAAYRQTWSDVTVRIRLQPDAGISAATVTALRNTWENAIEARWSDRWALAGPGEIALPIRFDVQWVVRLEHHLVRIQTGPARSNAGLWDTDDTGAVAAHEFGHLIGNSDEYADPVCPSRDPVSTGTVMDNNSNVVPARLLNRIAANVGANVIAVNPLA